MFNLIEKLQSKPEYARRQIAFVFSLAIVIIVFLIWVSTFGVRTESKEESDVTPLSSLKESSLSAFNDIVGIFKGVSDYSAQ